MTHGLVLRDMYRKTVVTIPKVKNKQKSEVHVLSPPPLHLNKKDLLPLLYVPLQFNKYENHALLDKGAIRSAMSEAELLKITTAHPEAVLKNLPS